jgi:hypothetical protein
MSNKLTFRLSNKIFRTNNPLSLKLLNCYSNEKKDFGYNLLQVNNARCGLKLNYVEQIFQQKQIRFSMTFDVRFRSLKRKQACFKCCFKTLRRMKERLHKLSNKAQDEMQSQRKGKLFL